ncbi:MAG: hypothetical protein IPH07_27450 [Deltaproteobacteria bacterium]|nr:hypothetical protein [Deltaproteobacteria bacterium]MBP7292232.1 hypothetical protein [Nannocystaceae bacterium]
MPPASTYAVKLLMSRHRSPLLGVLTLLSACAGSSIDDGGSFSGGLFSGSAETGGSATVGTASGTAGTAGTGATEGTEGMSSTSADASTTGSPSTTASSTDPSASSAVDSSGSDGSSGDPVQPFCGDGTIDPGEGCDDGNADDTDACLATCVAASCGDGFVQANVEACDDGVNDGSYGGCNPGCAQLGPFCGDAGVQAQEQCDPGVALPWVNVGCSAACVYDFSGITQLYCNGSCSWAGADSCDQADADIYCQLVTGDSTSTASSFQVVTALDAPGFACPSYGTNLGTMPGFGVNVSVWYQDSSILANHGGGEVIANAVCT